MLDEGMAQYGSLRAVEIVEGPKAAEQYRRTGYPGYYSEYSGLTYLTRSLAGLDRELSDLPLADGYLSRRVADSKGMLAWNMLSLTIGRETFSRFLKKFLREHAFQLVTWEEFLEANEAASGMDLKWFYEQWFNRKGVPDWQLTWKQDRRTVHGTITQSAPYYTATVEIQATGPRCERLMKKIDIRGATTEFSLPVTFKVESLELDPHFLYLHWTSEYRAEAKTLLPYTRADLKLQQDRLEEAEKEFKAALDQGEKSDIRGVRFMLEYGLAETLIQQNKLQEAKPHILGALSLPTRRKETLPWV